MQKDDLNVHVFQNRNWQPKIWSIDFFSNSWLSEDLSIGRILSEKKWGYGVNFWKNGSFVYRTLQNLHHRYFLMILILLTEQLYWRKNFCGCFRFIWQWLLIAILKSCAERSALKLYRTSLILPWCHDCNLSSNKRKPLQTFLIFLCCKQQKSFWKNVGSLAILFFFLRFHIALQAPEKCCKWPLSFGHQFSSDFI